MGTKKIAPVLQWLIRHEWSTWSAYPPGHKNDDTTWAAATKEVRDLLARAARSQSKKGARK